MCLYVCMRADGTRPTNLPPPPPTPQGQRNAAIHCYETFLKKRPPGTTAGDPALHGKVLEYVAHAHYLDKRYEVCMCMSMCGYGV